MWNISFITLFTSALCLHTWHSQRDEHTGHIVSSVVRWQAAPPMATCDRGGAPCRSSSSSRRNHWRCQKDKRAHRENFLLLLHYSRWITFKQLTSSSHFHSKHITPVFVALAPHHSTFTHSAVQRKAANMGLNTVLFWKILSFENTQICWSTKARMEK